MEENKIPPDSSSYTKSFIDKSHQKYCEAAQTVLSCMGFLAEQLPMKLPLIAAAAAAAKLLQSYPTLCNPIYRLQPIRLPHPWDSPGKNTGVGCHFLLQCMKVKSESEVAQSCPTAYQAPPSMGFSRQEYWSGVPLPSLYHSLGYCELLNIKDFPCGQGL